MKSTMDGNQKKRLVLLNGSLRGEESSSHKFLARVQSRLRPPERFPIQWVSPSISQGPAPAVDLEAMARADAIVIAFPLFDYSLPGGLTRLLEDFWAAELKMTVIPPARRARIYAIVNCAFPEPWIMEEAIRVVRNFCSRLGLAYRFSIAIASGPVTAATMKVPFLNGKLKRAFGLIIQDIDQEGGVDAALLRDVFVSPIIPKAIIIKIKEHYEKKAPQEFSAVAPG